MYFTHNDGCNSLNNHALFCLSLLSSGYLIWRNSILPYYIFAMFFTSGLKEIEMLPHGWTSSGGGIIGP